MKQKTAFRGTFTAAALLCALLFCAYVAFVLWAVAAPMLRVLFLLFGGAFLLVALLCFAVLRRRVVQFTNTLDETLDQMLDGRRVRTTQAEEESLLGKLQNKLERLWDIVQANQQHTLEEKQAVEALVSDISHQVKTPVANIRMYSEILQTRKMPPGQQAEFLAHIEAQAERLGFLTGAMVKMSRLETGVLQLRRSQRALLPVLQRVAEGLRANAIQKNITLDVECKEDLTACFDEQWTAEALYNLVDNAIKYTPAGGNVWVEADQWELYTRVTVRDDGPGIPEGEQAAVFARFVRGKNVGTAPGIGLGLYLARQIVQRQDGYMVLRPASGGGAVFEVFLPNVSKL